ncbi:MAG: GGDEF domain-containing protein [Clostridiales bacterium]|nr:GGDEF domain-containing protein [Clostridiales bacterium]
MDVRSVYITNFIGISILLILLYASRAKILRHRTEDRIFSFLVIGVTVGSLMEMFTYLIDGKLFFGARIFNYIANTYIFSFNMLLPFFLLVYVDLCLYGDKSRIVKRYKPQIIIGAVMLLVNIVNYFVPISYYVTEQNLYERRPFGYVYYAVIVYYCLTILFILRRYNKEYGTRSFLNFYMFLIPVIVGIGLQFMFFGLSLAWLASAIGLTGLFMMQQNEAAYIDSLVETYNRQYLDHILSAWIRRGYKFTGIMLDIDNFKNINDQFGHTEGDKALKTLADILKSSCKDHEWIFRFAGDEFIVLKLTLSPDELTSYMDEVNRQIAEQKQEKSRLQSVRFLRRQLL